jgi:hypothetical protein
MNLSGGGEKMNKKIMSMVIVFTITMISTLTVQSVYALGKPNKGETFTTIPWDSDPTLLPITVLVPPYEKYVGPVIESYPNPDGCFRSSFGSVRILAYQGALGEGTLTMTTIHGLGKLESSAVGSGSGTYNIIIDVTGDYGTGKLEGMARMSWVLDFSDTPWYYELWTMSLHGKGDLKGLNVFVEAYAEMLFAPPFYVQWWNTTIS